jgi:hypothetical protein
MTTTDRPDVETAFEERVVETPLEVIEVEGVTGVFGTTLSVVEMTGVVVVEAGLAGEGLEEMLVVRSGIKLPPGVVQGRRLSRRLLRMPVSNEAEAEVDVSVAESVATRWEKARKRTDANMTSFMFVLVCLVKGLVARLVFRLGVLQEKRYIVLVLCCD